MHWVTRHKATVGFLLGLLTAAVATVLAVTLRGDDGALMLGIVGVCAVAGLMTLGLVYRKRG